MRIRLNLFWIVPIMLIYSCYSTNVTKGDAAAYNLAYVKAAKYYEKALKYKDNADVSAKLAMVYEHLNNMHVKTN